MSRNNGRTPQFLQKLCEIVENEPFIEWSKSGTSILILDKQRFQREVLPRFFKATKLSSFVRQLNMYGFHKVAPTEESMPADGGEFRHELFIRNRPDLIKQIQRRPVQRSADGKKKPKVETAPPKVNTSRRSSRKRTSRKRESSSESVNTTPRSDRRHTQSPASATAGGSMRMRAAGIGLMPVMGAPPIISEETAPTTLLSALESRDRVIRVNKQLQIQVEHYRRENELLKLKIREMGLKRSRDLAWSGDTDALAQQRPAKRRPGDITAPSVPPRPRGLRNLRVDVDAPPGGGIGKLGLTPNLATDQPISPSMRSLLSAVQQSTQAEAMGSLDTPFVPKPAGNFPETPSGTAFQ